MDTAPLIQRIDRLERESRRLKAIGAVLFLGLAAVGTMGQAPPKAVPKRVEAEEFVLWGQNGKARAILGVVNNEPSLALIDQRGDVRASLAVLADGTAGLGLSASNEKGRILLSVSLDGFSQLSFRDGNGKVRASLREGGADGPSLILVDENQRIRAALGGVTIEGTPSGIKETRPASSLVLFGTDGKVF